MGEGWSGENGTGASLDVKPSPRVTRKVTKNSKPVEGCPEADNQRAIGTFHSRRRAPFRAGPLPKNMVGMRCAASEISWRALAAGGVELMTDGTHQCMCHPGSTRLPPTKFRTRRSGSLPGFKGARSKRPDDHGTVIQATMPAFANWQGAWSDRRRRGIFPLQLQPSILLNHSAQRPRSSAGALLPRARRTARTALHRHSNLPGRRSSPAHVCWSGG